MSDTAGSANWEVKGRLVEASNATLLVSIDGRAHVYKPVAGERPLWDFPDGTLGFRELTAYELSRQLGWDLVPRTTWVEDGPFGPGVVQEWIDHGEESPAGVFPAAAIPPGWCSVVEGHDEHGRPVAVAHERSERLRRVAAFDVVINNADRKGGHLLVDRAGALAGIDHGLSFHAHHKLRTIVWGFAGESLPPDVAADLARCLDTGLAAAVTEHLTSDERGALAERITELLDADRFPYPVQGGPVLPWPPM